MTTYFLRVPSRHLAVSIYVVHCIEKLLIMLIVLALRFFRTMRYVIQTDLDHRSCYYVDIILPCAFSNDVQEMSWIVVRLESSPIQ